MERTVDLELGLAVFVDLAFDPIVRSFRSSTDNDLCRPLVVSFAHILFDIFGPSKPLHVNVADEREGKERNLTA